MGVRHGRSEFGWRPLLSVSTPLEPDKTSRHHLPPGGHRTMTAPYSTAADLSTAWLNTVVAVVSAPERKAFHSVTRIESPTTENQRVRSAVDQLMADLGHPGVETVANTIFPAALAASCRSPEELAQRYQAIYPRLRKLHRAN